MRITHIALPAALCLFAGSAALAQSGHGPVTIEAKGASGASVGTITLTEAPKGVLLKVELTGLTPGWHGLHFHEKGDCSVAGFTSAGAHVHGDKPAVHGLLNPSANESGDLPNVFAGSDGKATAEVFSPFVSLHHAAAGRPALMDADGSSVVVHANADDHTSQPIGGAGARVACAVIKAPAGHNH